MHTNISSHRKQIIPKSSHTAKQFLTVVRMINLLNISTERTFHSAMSSRVLLDIRATLDAPYNLTELVAEACASDDDSLGAAADSGGFDDGLIYARRSSSSIELRERISNAETQTDADVESGSDDHEIVPGGRVTPLPRKRTIFGVRMPI
jgi:hypothetical protein